MSIPPIILGDSAFPFESFLMKPYTNAVLTKQQRNFNNRLSHARMVTEGAYGHLKGRWRFLHRKSEGNLYDAKIAALSCVVLQNICLDQGDTLPSELDMTLDSATNQKRDRETICNLLLMRLSCKTFDPSNNKAVKLREAINKKLWKELENSKQQVDMDLEN